MRLGYVSVFVCVWGGGVVRACVGACVRACVCMCVCMGGHGMVVCVWVGGGGSRCVGGWGVHARSVR